MFKTKQLICKITLISLPFFSLGQGQPNFTPEGRVDLNTNELVLNEGTESEIRIPPPSFNQNMETPDVTVNFDGSLDLNDGLEPLVPPEYAEIVLLGDGEAQSFGNFGTDSSGSEKGVFADIILQHKTTGTVAVWFMQNVDTSSLPTDTAGITVLPDWDPIPGNDFNNDGIADIVFQLKDRNAGSIALWTMDKISPTNTVGVAVLPGWNVCATGDFGQFANEGEGNNDLVIQHSNGTVGIWFMDQTVSLGGTSIAVLPDWEVVAAADLNNDGKPDLLFQNSSGVVAIWFMDGINPTTSAGIGEFGDFRIKGVADYNVDGNNDILFQDSSGVSIVWTMDGINLINSYNISATPGWDVVGPR